MSNTANTANVTAIDSKKPPTKQELIAANIKLLIGQLEAGHSDALTNYLTAMSRFHNYSFGNVLEIARQMPTATRVAGFWTWKNMGRSVNAGAKGIRILAPIVGVRRKKDEEAKKDITKQNERVLLGFRNAYVFDISQTNGVDLPTVHEVSGDPGDNIDRLAAFVKSKGIALVYNANIAPALGMSYGGRIAILPGQSKAEEFTTRSYTRNTRILRKRGTTTCDSRVLRKCLRTSASSASPLPLERNCKTCATLRPQPQPLERSLLLWETQIINATEYRNVSLALLNESTTNPRRTFEETALKELADSIRSQGVLSPLLVRPLTENGFEIIAGARRYRAAQIAEQATVPVRIVNLSDAAALEAQLVENLIRSEIHPMEEAQGFRALLDLEDPKYSIEQIAAKVGKTPAFVAQRLKLTDLAPAAVEAFYDDSIGVGHALLLAKLPADQQEQALKACFKEVYANGDKPAKVLLPVRNLQFWIATNVLLILKDAPFNKRDAQLVPIAGSCAECPKRTGHNKLLFGDDLGKQGDQCTDPTCYQAKVDAHVAKTIAAKPELVQISTAYGVQSEGSPVLPRNRYVALRDDRPKSNDEAKRPEFKKCKYTTEAIITEGSDVGSIHKVCANLNCPVHHPKQTSGRDEARWKAEQEKQRRDQAIASATGLRVLSAIAAAVPVRLLKRDLFFVLEKLLSVLDESRIETLARQHGIRQKRDEGGVAKTLLAFMRRTDEGTLSRLMVEVTILLASSRQNGNAVLKDAATLYKVDAEAIGQKVKQEFAAKAKAKKDPRPEAKPVAKAKKAA